MNGGDEDYFGTQKKSGRTFLLRPITTNIFVGANDQIPFDYAMETLIYHFFVLCLSYFYQSHHSRGLGKVQVLFYSIIMLITLLNI